MSKTILITGSSTGFGRDTAETLARSGHTVFASMRNVNDRNKTHSDALQAIGVTTLELDVTNQNSINTAVELIENKAGKIDVLINNAGVASAGVTEAFTTEQMHDLFNVNVFGLHRVTRSVLPLMRKHQNGLIINVGSILGRVTFPFFGVYGASKFAVEALNDSLRYEVSQFGVDVSLVQPSAYPTQMYSNADQTKDDARVKNPHDVAKAIDQLVNTPHGKRPSRVVVGTSFGADNINLSTEPIQAQTISELGLEHLNKLKFS